ncbi:MAG: hydrogenase formation protein HypD [Planctomycetaceae bacterium]
MKHLDEFRDPELAQRLLEVIRKTATRKHILMEVCGGQTHSLLRHGIESELEEVVELIHGPGCPVCVTPVESIDFAQRLALRNDVTLTLFGDMLRVPGSRCSLQDVRAQGGRIQIVYSPLDAVELARKSPDRRIVFFAVGFETTLPATALAVLQARSLQLQNFTLLTAHVRVPPAMEAILSAPGNRVEGFLAAGHVCTISGFESYRSMASRYRVPTAVTGFEPVDLLEGILDVVRQLEAGRCEVTNHYARSVRPEGNPHAQRMIEDVYEIADQPWRGLGLISEGGYALRNDFQDFDARSRFVEDLIPDSAAALGNECRSGEVLTGRLKPTECPHFGTKCTPLTPLGAPMVSSEGACAAYYRYAGSPDFTRLRCPVVSAQ